MTDIIAAIEAAQARAMRVRPPVGGFPYLAEALRLAGVERYLFDVPSASTILVTAEGDILQPGSLQRQEPSIVAPFDEAALIRALRADQAGHTTFAEFVAATLDAGVVRYVVDTAARTCTYIGARDESYVETYPTVRLPAE